MEEVYRYLRLLKRFRYTLFIVPIFAVIITFFLVKNMPDSYVSQAQISTGIVDDTRQNLLSEAGILKGAEINQEFSNLTEMMRMKKMLDQISYLLIIHDFTSNAPFRAKSSLIRELSKAKQEHALDVFRYKYNRTEGLNLWNKDQSSLYNILRSEKYDSESIKNKLKIFRASESDFINIEFESENPKLSAFVVNTLSEEFIKYYSVLIKANQRKANDFLKNLLQEKKIAMDNEVRTLRDYKITNRVLNLDEQSSQLYQEILQYSDRKQQTIEGIAAKAGALNEIDRKFSSRERGYIESTLTKVNIDIMDIKEELKSLNELYVQNDFDPKYKTSIDSLQFILSSRINKSTDQYIYNPLVTKQDLVQKKLELGIELDLAKYSMASMEKELDILNAQFDKLVPHEADVQSMERDVDVASKEYLDILNKYNQSNLESTFSVKLNFVQQAMPGLPQPSKKMLLVIISGIVSFIFCLVVFFIIFFVDNSIKIAKELADKTDVPVLGSLSLLKGPVHMKNIWNNNNAAPAIKNFKVQLRSLRFEIESVLKGKVLILTSLRASEGKTTVALSLAYAWEVTNKKILIIDGNFSNPKISDSIEHKIYLEDYLEDKVTLEKPSEQASLTFLSNKGGDTTLLETANEKLIAQKLEDLKAIFDLIIIETAALDKLNLAKEWMEFGDTIISVFESGKVLNENKKININYLKDLDNKFAGWVLNKVSAE